MSHVGRQAHSHTELGNQRDIGGCRTVVHIHHDTAISLNGICQCQVSAYRECHVGNDLMILDADGFDCAVFGCIAPRGCTFSKMSGMLVVVLGFPEIGLQGSLQYLLAIDHP